MNTSPAPQPEAAAPSPQELAALDRELGLDRLADKPHWGEGMASIIARLPWAC